MNVEVIDYDFEFNLVTSKKNKAADSV